MSVTSAQVAMSTTAAALNTASRNWINLKVTNQGASAVFLGPSGVTSSTGVSIAASGGTYQVDLPPGDVLYGLTDSGTSTLGVLRVSS